MQPSERPDISVVIASVNGLPYPLACLQALAEQDAAVPSEVILADCTGTATVAAVREHFPDVHILAFEEQKSVPWLRAAGMRAARGRLVAVTEDHCVPHPDWFRQILAAHQRTGWAAVGGSVENAAIDRLVDWAVFFCEYSQHMAPVPEGPSDFIPGMNVAYDMDVLASVRDVFEEGLWENFLHDRLRAAGHILGMDPKIVVDHKKYFTVPMFLSERFHYSRSFAGMRVQEAAVGRRLAWAGASFLLPPLLIGRLTRNVLQRRRHLSWYVRCLPLVVLFTLAWSVGELAGYLTGPGDSLLKVR
ncbi:MAG: glycosyltransferase [Actinomycetota bacterium]|nr:glycosyltransferase [Actinomycetota bacterium]